MLTFQEYWIEPILTGKKTATIRGWATSEVELGSVHEAGTVELPQKIFAKLHITGIRKIRLGDLTDDLTRRDAPGATAEAVRGFWMKRGHGPDKEVWYVEFELVKT